SPGHRSFHVSPVMSTCRLQVWRSVADAEEVRQPEHIGLDRRAFLRLEVGADGGALVFGQVLAALTLAVVRVRQRRPEPALLLADRVRAAEHGHEAVAARAAEWPHPLGLVGAPRER